jgi:hypothetical protein
MAKPIMAFQHPPEPPPTKHLHLPNLANVTQVPSEEAELTEESDFDDFPEDVSTFFKTPQKTSDKMRLRAVPPKKYAVDGEEELGDVGSDDSDFNPNAEREQRERKARRRRGIVGDSSDEC